MAEFLLETGLEDIHKMKQQETPTTTYARGTKRLDYILVTPDLVQTVRRAGYLPVHDGVIADHRLCYIDCNLVEFLGGNVNNIIRPHMRLFKCDDKARCKIFITELKQHMERNKTKERITKIAKELREEGDNQQLIDKYNMLDYNLQCSIKGAVKKVGRANFGYYRSPALTTAGRKVLVWKAIWSCKKRKQPISSVIRRNIGLTEYSEQALATLTLQQIRIELRGAVMALKEIQKEARRMRELWLEEMAMRNAIEDGNQDAQRVLKTMLKKMSTKAMNEKLNRINHGDRGGLDFIEVPKGEWFTSAETG